MADAMKQVNVTSSILGVSRTGYTVNRVSLFELGVAVKPKMLTSVETWDLQVLDYTKDIVYGGLFDEIC